jgi:hypothetical protein
MSGVAALSSEARTLYADIDAELMRHDPFGLRGAAGGYVVDGAIVAVLEHDDGSASAGDEKGLMSYLLGANHHADCAAWGCEGEGWENGCTCGLTRLQRLARLARRAVRIGDET